MRPIYETPQDRENEASVRDRICELYNCKCRQSVELSSVDGMLVDKDDNGVAIIEIKTRRNAHDKYPTYMLSANKWRSGMKIAEHYRLPFLLFVKFTDGIFYTKLKKHYETARGGRTDRLDPYDQEECIYIDMNNFRRMEYE